MAIDKALQPVGPILHRRYRFGLQLARAVEEYQVVVERAQHQQGCSAESGHAESEQPQSLLLAGHRRLPRSCCSRSKVTMLSR